MVLSARARDEKDEGRDFVDDIETSSIMNLLCKLRSREVETSSVSELVTFK